MFMKPFHTRSQLIPIPPIHIQTSPQQISTPFSQTLRSPRPFMRKRHQRVPILKSHKSRINKAAILIPQIRLKIPHTSFLIKPILP